MNRLETYIKQVRGISYSPKDISEIPMEDYIPILKANNIKENGIDISSLIYIHKSKVKKEQLIKKGDLLLAASSGSRDIVGKNIFFENDFNGSFGAFCKVVRPNKNINPRYLSVFFKTPIYKRHISKLIQGANINNLKSEDINSLNIPDFSEIEQIQIAEILTQAGDLITNRKDSINLLDEFLKSFFIEKFIKKEYPIVKLQDITLKITDGEHAKPTYLETGMPFISVKNISKGSLDFTDCKFVSNDDHIKFNKRCNPEFEDIIYTKVGATYGRAVVVNTIEPFSLYVSVALIKPDKTKVNPFFLNAAINHPFVKRQADKSIKGAGVPDLHLIEIKSFKIPFPPIEKQIEFAIIVEKIEGLRKEYEASLKELENMYGVLSQKAFNGELKLDKVKTDSKIEYFETPVAGSLVPITEEQKLPEFSKKDISIQDMTLDDYYNIPDEIIAEYGSIEKHHEDWEFMLKKFFHDSPIDLNRLQEIYDRVTYEKGSWFVFEDWKSYIFGKLSEPKSFLRQKYNPETNQLELLINEIKKA